MILRTRRFGAFSIAIMLSAQLLGCSPESPETSPEKSQAVAATRRDSGSAPDAASGRAADLDPTSRSQEPGYIGSTACIACHPEAGERWKDSHHAWAWRAPDESSVLALFDGQRIEHDGVEVELARRASPAEGAQSSESTRGEYVFRVDPDGPNEMAYPIVATLGITPLQQYLVETEPGRLQALDLAWDAERKRWYDLYPEERLASDDGMHWSGPYKNHNARCAECHATDYAKNYRPRERVYESEQAEIGVGCEACHGPGAAHEAWAETPDGFDPARWNEVGSRGLALRFEDADPEAEIQQCAGCHSRRESLTSRTPRPGTLFQDAYRLSTLRPGLYRPDGRIEGEVYVYGSFLQSAMYAKGVRCSDCHEPHSADLRFEGDLVCTQCHNEQGRSEFPTIPKGRFDSAEHHFHPAEGEGARCVSCHMPEEVYMGIDGRRDHSFRIPRPHLSERLDTPNACNDCHTDRSPKWAADEIAKRYPEGRQARSHWGEEFAAARIGPDDETISALLARARDMTLPEIVRASALAHLQPFAEPLLSDAVARLLEDGAPMVRIEAADLQIAAPAETRAARLAPLLEDPLRSVRIAAVRGLLMPAAANAVPAESKAAWQAALREYQASLFARSDFPEVQLMLAGMAMQLGQVRAAESAFEEALRQDPQFEDAWRGLSRLKALTGDLPGARRTLDTAIAAVPTSAGLRVQLADIALASGDRTAAARALDEAEELDPEAPGLEAVRDYLLQQAQSQEQSP